jgi:hypothetical protein
MQTTRRGTLPPQLAEQLRLLGARLGSGVPRSQLDEVLSGLSALPAESVVHVSREIADTAKLGWWKPRRKSGWLKKLFGLPLSEKDLLKRDPDYGWLFLFHYDGYVREVALDAIARPPASPFMLAALAWRLNDWVKPVRQAAIRCAQRVLPLTGDEIASVTARYLLDRRFAWGRWNEESDVLDLVLARAGVMAALATELREASTGPLPICLRQALRYPAIDAHLPHLAARAIQPAVRALAYKCLLNGEALWPSGYEWQWIDKVYGLRRRVIKFDSRPVVRARPLAELMRDALRDKSPKVRVAAAAALSKVRSQLGNTDALVRELAQDRSAGVRLYADYMLRNPVTPAP